MQKKKACVVFRAWRRVHWMDFSHHAVRPPRNHSYMLLSAYATDIDPMTLLTQLNLT